MTDRLMPGRSPRTGRQRDRRRFPARRINRKPSRPVYLEALEPRLSPASTFDLKSLATLISNDATALNSHLQTVVGPFASVPFVGDGLHTINSVTDQLNGFLQALENDAPQPIGPQSQVLYHVGSVIVSASSQDGQTLDLSVQENDTLSSAINFQLGSFLQIHGSDQMSLSGTPELDFQFGYQVDSQGNATAPSLGNNNSLKLTVTASFPGHFEATLAGLLDAYITDNGLGENTPSSVTATVQAGFDDDGNFESPSLSGGADLNLHFDLAFAHDTNGQPMSGLPFNLHLSSDFLLNWTFGYDDTDAAGSGLYSGLNTLEFTGLQLYLGVGAAPDFIRSVADRVDQFIQPMLPFLDFFQKEVPILNDFGVHETFQDLLNQTGVLTQSENDALNEIRLFEKLDNAISGPEIGIPLGTLDLSPTSSASALSFAEGKFDSLAQLPVLSNLISSVESQLTLPAFDGQSNLPMIPTLQQYGFSFPMLEDSPQNVVFQLLLGHNEDLVDFKLQPLVADLNIDVGISVGFFGFGLQGALHLEMNLGAGYDTKGLADAVQAIVNPSSIPPGKTLGSVLAGDLAEGFYLDETPLDTTNGVTHYATGIDISGDVSANATLLAVGASADIRADVSLHLRDPNDANLSDALPGDPNDHKKVRLTELLPGLSRSPLKVFGLEGAVTASANINVGLELGIFNLTAYTYNLATVDIVRFDNDSSSAPPPDAKNPQEITIDFTSIPGATDTIYVKPFEEHVEGNAAIDPDGKAFGDADSYTELSGIEVLYPNGSYDLYPTESTLWVYGSGEPEDQFTEPPGYYYIYSDFVADDPGSGNQRVIVETGSDAVDQYNDGVLSDSTATELFPIGNVFAALSSIELHGGDGNDYFDVSQFTEGYGGLATLFGASGNDTLIGGTRIDGGGGQDTLIAPNGQSAYLSADDFHNGTFDDGSYLQAGVGGTYTLEGGEGDDWFEVPLADQTTTQVTAGFLGQGIGATVGNDTLNIVNLVQPVEANDFGVTQPPPPVTDLVAITSTSGNSYSVIDTEHQGASITAFQVSGIQISEEGDQSGIVVVPDVSSSGLRQVSVSFDASTSGNSVDVVDRSAGTDTLDLRGDGDGGAVLQAEGAGENAYETYVYVHGLKAGDELGFSTYSDSNTFNFYLDNTYAFNVFVSNLSDGPFGQDLNVDASNFGFLSEPGDGNSVSVLNNSVTVTPGGHRDFGFGNGSLIGTVGPVSVDFIGKIHSLSIETPGGGSAVTVDQESYNPGSGIIPVPQGNVNPINLTVSGSNAGDQYTVLSQSKDLTINGGSGADTFTMMQGSGGRTSLYGGAGDDTFYLSGDALLQAIVDGQAGDDSYYVSVAFPSIDDISIDDSGLGDANALYVEDKNLYDPFNLFSSAIINYTVTTQGVTRSGVDLDPFNLFGSDTDHVTFFYSANVTALVVDAGSNYHNNVQIQDIPFGDSVTVNAGSQDDDVTAGDQDHSLNKLSGGLTVHGNTGTVLTLNDADNLPTVFVGIAGPDATVTPVQTTYAVGSGELTRTTQLVLDPAPPTPRPPLSWTVNYNAIAQLVIDGGPDIAQGYTYQLNNKAGAAQVVINAASDNDAVSTLPDMSNVVVNGNGGTTLTVDERSLVAGLVFLPGSVQPVTSIPMWASVTVGANQITGTAAGEYIPALPPVPPFWNDNLAITYYDLANVTVEGSPDGGIAGTYQINSTAGTAAVTIFGNGPADAVTLGDASDSLNGVTALVTVLGNHKTTLTIDDSANIDRGTYIPIETQYVVNSGDRTSLTRTETAVELGLFTASVMPVEFWDLASFAIDGGPGGHNDFQVNSTKGSGSGTINAAGFADKVTVGDTVNNVDDVGQLFVNGDSSTIVSVQDLESGVVSLPLATGVTEQFVYDSPSYTIDSQHVTVATQGHIAISGANTFEPAPSLESVVTYSDVFSVSVSNGPNASKFSVLATAAATPVAINAGPGGDTVNIGSSADMMDPIASTVTVTGAGGNTTINVDDQANSGNADYEVADSTVTRTPFTFGLPEGSPAQTVNYFSVASVNVYGGNARDLYGAGSTLAGTSVALYSGGGVDNEFFAEGDGDILDALQGPVALHGDGEDLAFVYDGESTVGHTYTVTADTVVRDGIASVSYDGMIEMVLATGDNPYTPPSPDTVYVESSAPRTLTIAAVGASDTVIVGTPETGGRSLQNLEGQVWVQSVATEAATVDIDDSGNASTAARDVSFDHPQGGGYQIDGIAPQPIGIAVGTGSKVRVQGDSAAEAFHLNGLTPGINLTVDGGGGSNTLDTGTSGLSGNLDQKLTLENVAVSNLLITGDLSGSLLAQDIGSSTAPIQSIKVDGEITSTGIVKVNYVTSFTVAGDLDGLVRAFGPVSGSAASIGTITIGGALNGTLSAAAGAGLGDINVNGTSVTSSGNIIENDPSNDFRDLSIAGSFSGNISAANAAAITIGRDFSGSIHVTQTLRALTVGGDLTGTVTAANISDLAVGGALSGQVHVSGQLGSVSAGSVTSLTSPDAHGPLVLDVTLAGVERKLVATPLAGDAINAVSFSYTLSASGPGDPSVTVDVTNSDPAHDQFDLSVLSSSALARFDLAQLDSTAGAAGIRDVLVDGNLMAGAIYLPKDHLGSVAVPGSAAVHSIYAGSVQALAFGSLTFKNGTLAAQNADAFAAAQLLDPRTGLAQANGTFQVPFAGSQPVALFLVLAPRGGLAVDNVLFTDQAQADSAVTAAVTVSPTFLRGWWSSIQTVALEGNGGSLATSLPIDQAITSTGWLGDLTIASWEGLTANVTAPSIQGNIDVPFGSISGTIQTTAGDLGRTFVDSRGRASATTILSGLSISGRIISRGNLLSEIVAGCGISGVIAAQGDLGATIGSTRVGGIVTDGEISGQIVALGNIAGDIVDVGGLVGGRIAAKGNILGNVIIDGAFDQNAAVVAGGSIGRAAAGTALQANKVQGVLAAEGTINLGTRTNVSKAAFFGANLKGTSDAAAVDAIFTSGGQALTFDLPGQELEGLDLILTDLARLRVVKQHLTGTTA